jgi:ribosomal protein S18 acetylase RimI-like enzyme
MIWFGVQERISGAKFGWIYDITVDIEFRGRGIGTMLMQRACEHFETRGVLGIGLMVLIGNEAARRLYEKVGFRGYSIYMLKKL